jgi:hypothetical protein
MLIYGGNSSNGPLSNIHILDLETYTWEVPPVIGKHPGTRESMGFCSNKGKIYVTCGNVSADSENEIYSNDLYEFSLNSNNAVSCIAIDPIGEKPCCRMEPSITIINDN